MMTDTFQAIIDAVKKQEYHHAENLCWSALKSQPNSSLIKKWLGIALLQQKKYEGALDALLQSLPDHKNDFDVFLFGENDHLFKEYHIDKHLEYTSFLPKDRITGLIQYEEDETGKYYPAYHAHYDWDYSSVEEYNGKKFAHFTNLHQATFILTKDQLHTIGAKFDFTQFFGPSRYSEKCKVNTDIYQFGDWKKLICISDFKDNLIHHQYNDSICQLL